MAFGKLVDKHSFTCLKGLGPGKLTNSQQQGTSHSPNYGPPQQAKEEEGGSVYDAHDSKHSIEWCMDCSMEEICKTQIPML